MTIINKRLLKNVVDILHVVKNSSGRTVTSTDTDVPCRISESRKFIRDETGDHIIHKTQLFFHPDDAPSNFDEISLDNKIRQIESILAPRDSQGIIHHYEVFLK
jgi:hypothetical protein